jgi:hypothetical protein
MIQAVMTRHSYALLALLAGCSAARVVLAPGVPPALKVPANEVVSLEAFATGVQVYQCVAGKADPKKLEWVFKAPEAELFDRDGKPLGRHYAGPTWESKDGSKVVGAVKAQEPGRPGAIAWLLLGVKEASGRGAFARTTSIQRVDTVDGRAPGEGCSAARSGQESRVPYKATYYFYRQGSKSWFDIF